MKSIMLIIATTTILLAGCMPADSGSAKTGNPADYEYKGRPDPLLAQSAEERATILSARFKLIQARQ